MERQHYRGVGAGLVHGWGQGDAPVPTGAAITGGEGQREVIAHTPTAELVKEGLDQAKRLVREEAHLIAADLKAQAKKAARGMGTAAAGGVVLFAGFLTLCAMVVMALATVMAGWLAALITGVALCVIGALMARGGLERAKKARPEQSIHSLEEDKRWASETMHAMKSKTRVNA